jgi:hypothetical protein
MVFAIAVTGVSVGLFFKRILQVNSQFFDQEKAEE